MPRPTLPRSGNDETVLREHLSKLSVWKVLLLHGTYDDRFDQDDIAERLNRIGVNIEPQFITRLYHLAVENAAEASKAK
jgi:hypothetical protein